LREKEAKDQLFKSTFLGTRKVAKEIWAANNLLKIQHSLIKNNMYYCGK
jgi:hypothetical protein